MSPLIRNPTTRARLEGLVLGMLTTVVIIWFAAPIVTGDWTLL